MGFINFRDSNGVANERKRRMKLAEARQAIPEAEEFKQIRKIKEQESLERLKEFAYINDERGIGVEFGVGFNDNKTYYSVEDLEK